MGTKTRKLGNTLGQDISWQSVKTTNFTAVAGEGYFVDTTSGVITVTFPSTASVGDTFIIKDYARTFATNKLSIDRNGNNVDGVAANGEFVNSGQVTQFVYVDSTKGWSAVSDDTVGNYGAKYVTATGGTITTVGNYKVHAFTGDGCFVVSCAGNPGGSAGVTYFVLAGGGAGGGYNGGTNGGGGGAGGFRIANCFSVTGTTYPITVGAGGSPGGPTGVGGSGSNSVFSTITSTGGGGGGGPGNGVSGGSGGGAGGGQPAGGTGNTPPVSPPQGNSGGAGGANSTTGGGGGSGAAGSDAKGPANPNGSGPGGVGTDITPYFGVAPANYYIADAGPGTPGTASGYYGAGGGGGASFPHNSYPNGGGGTGGAGSGGVYGGPGGCARGNSGSGGGGSLNNNSNAGAGGKGYVLIKYKYQN